MLTGVCGGVGAMAFSGVFCGGGGRPHPNPPPEGEGILALCGVGTLRPVPPEGEGILAIFCLGMRGCQVGLGVV